MTFERYHPVGALATTVKTIWIASGGQDEVAEPDPIVPDGCVEIVFDLGDRFRGPDGTLQPRDLLAGQMTRPVTAVPTGDVDLLGVRFWSGRAGAAMRHAMGSLHDHLIPASEVVAGAGVLADELGNVAPAHRLDHLQRRLPGLLGAVDADRRRLVDAVINMIGASRWCDATASRAPVSRRGRVNDEGPRPHHPPAPGPGVAGRPGAAVRRRHRRRVRLQRSGAPHPRLPRADRPPARFTTGRDSLADLIREIPFPVKHPPPL